MNIQDLIRAIKSQTVIGTISGSTSGTLNASSLTSGAIVSTSDIRRVILNTEGEVSLALTYADASVKTKTYPKGKHQIDLALYQYPITNITVTNSAASDVDVDIKWFSKR